MATSLAMRIAQVPTIDYQVPPLKYGAVHSLVYDLSLALADAGHEVTIFADAKSRIKAANIELAGTEVELVDDPINPYRKAEIAQFLNVLSRQSEFDLIHWHYDPIALNCHIDGREFNLMELVHDKSLLTLHFSPQYGNNSDYYKQHKEVWDLNYVSISLNQRKGVEFLNFIENIYHGIDTDTFSFEPDPDDYLLFIGRISPEKGIVQAIEVAKKSGRKLKIAARLEEKYQQFYKENVEPHIDGKQIQYLGEIGFPDKIGLYQKAAATLFPIQWEEPFGLVLIESISCGTPVIAFRRGAVPEVLEDGKTGFIVDDIEQMVSAVSKIDSIDRRICREEAVKRFDAKRMIADYTKLYDKLLNAQSETHLTPPGH